jgi:transcriptional regulator with PAS, ATPase and Fis domain
MRILLNYHWPGNVRELSNIIERAINMTEDQVLKPDVFPNSIRKSQGKYLPPQAPIISNYVDEKTIRDCLRRNRDNRSRVAKELGISRSSLYRKLKKFSIV